MAKQSLKDTVPDNEIVRNGEVKNVPNYIFPDGEYAVTGKYRDYSLVTKRIAYRTGTEEDGVNNGKVIEYTTWEDYLCFSSTLEGIFDSYAKILKLSEFKKKKLMTDIKELIEINNKISDLITKTLSDYDKSFNKDQQETVELLDIKEHLKTSIDEANKTREELLKKNAEVDRLIETIKEKSVYIINRDKPKKHRDKKEEE